MSEPTYRLSRSSAWDHAQIARFLEEQRLPLRLGFETAAGPLVVPLWFHFDGAHFWCASQQDTLLVRSLQERPACALDVSTNDIPYRGLRGRASVTCDPEQGQAVLGRLMARYLSDDQARLARWLQRRSDTEVALKITPNWLTAWDFSDRMRGT
jgi:nitroimidazol reductase NimA-like FMN-containing flavoprotein (pyridoxamine 5'-phosphate oxidase superfamily)